MNEEGIVLTHVDSNQANDAEVEGRFKRDANTRPGDSGMDYACPLETVLAGSVECEREIHPWRRRASMLRKASSASQISNCASSTCGCAMLTGRPPRRYLTNCETLNASPASGVRRKGSAKD